MAAKDDETQVVPPKRVGCYVDGFNLYFGLRESEMRRFLWLDVRALAAILVGNDEVLSYTKYFTARVRGGRRTDSPEYYKERNAKQKRQSNYLDAIAASGGVEIIEGQYRENEVKCNNCGRTWNSPQEKMTDVNIATQMIFDAFADRFDLAILISGDSDLVPPIREIRNLLPEKEFKAAFPPARFSNELKKFANDHCRIGEDALGKCQFQDGVSLSNGYKVSRPEKWR